MKITNMSIRNTIVCCLALLLATPLMGFHKLDKIDEAGKLTFSVSFPESLCKEILDGRIMLLISTRESPEPRFQIGYGLQTQQVFGIDVEGLKAGEEAIIDNEVFGYPVRSVSRIPAGEYWVQAVLHRYETFHRSDGHTLKLPMDRGEGQHWNFAPGNLYSTPKKMTIDPAENKVIPLILDKTMPPLPQPEDTKYIRHIKIQSELLTRFWGCPMHLGAIVLLPHGFDDHPEARYPLVINHSHFRRTLEEFRETPPDRNLQGPAKIFTESAYRLYKDWTSEGFPRFVLILIQHANPYYDDSYAVNSANVGPYGDAITYELIPHVEKEFRCIGEGWARTLYGGSTGGWESLGVQIFYPDEYNGCWAFCPDSVDFRAYQTINLYEDKNAYYQESPWKRTRRPGVRNNLGHVFATIQEMSYCEHALGSKRRSGQQLDIFQAVFGPVGEDGYPKPIWDAVTGEIDKSVAEYWRENYDLSYILERDWEKFGSKLKGKIHIYTGDMDTFYLNNSVYLMEEFLESTTDPYYDGEIVYGDRYEHCWTGDPDNPLIEAWGTVLQRFLPKMAEHIIKTAPPGADTSSWRY